MLTCKTISLVSRILEGIRDTEYITIGTIAAKLEGFITFTVSAIVADNDDNSGSVTVDGCTIDFVMKSYSLGYRTYKRIVTTSICATVQ